MQPNQFEALVWQYYQDHGRHDLPWRTPEPDGSFDPYKIMVSEMMLQQTQVLRVIPKYLGFIEMFPTCKSLAEASLAQVLQAWSGLGYNRRAKYLWHAARMIEKDFGGAVPYTIEDLVRLPGIGRNTAGAIMAYAYDQPVVFIETNIRTVFIHYFFDDDSLVSDAEVALLLDRTMYVIMNDMSLPYSPRTWYWALMDYGTHLKRTIGNVGRRSTAYTKQSIFHGSRRQIRGKVLAHLREKPRMLPELQAHIKDERLTDVLADLLHEKLISWHKDGYKLGDS